MSQKEHIREASYHMDQARRFYPHFEHGMSVEADGIIVTLRHPDTGTQLDRMVSWDDINTSYTNHLVNAQSYILAHLSAHTAKVETDEQSTFLW